MQLSSNLAGSLAVRDPTESSLEDRRFLKEGSPQASVQISTDN